MYKKPRIVFMGTPAFAAAILADILAANIDVACVVTTPDKPAGRGQKMHQSAVKLLAESQNLQILQPEKLRDPSFIASLESLKADIFVVVAFRMLPEMVWRIPPKGTFNLHASLLPNYRGAAPINWAIINGETQTGVTTFLINEDIDTGAILLQKEVTIAANETAGTLHDKLLKPGGELVVETINRLINNNIKPIPQPIVKIVKSAPKIFKDNCRIDWQWPGMQIERHIRGLSPYPGAFAFLADQSENQQVKIGDAAFIEGNENHQIGAFLVHDKKLIAATRDGLLQIKSLQPQGKRMMSAVDFLNGLKQQPNELKWI